MTLFWRDVIFEVVALVVFAVIALRPPRFALSGLKAAERAWSRAARHKKLSIVAVILLVIACRFSYWRVFEVPLPEVHDEFSYLLAGDTFASGRLTNPPHPMWQHFESFHIIQQPTYQSMYPVAQGLVLAAGQVLFHQPWFGVLLSVAFMCGAFVWMLQGWMPPRWALLGGVLIALRVGLFSYWMNSYWGGATAAIGGALVLGAYPRLRRRTRVVHAIVFGLGLALLANSRPYEGLLLSIPVVVVLLAWMFSRKAPPLRVSLQRVVLPVTAILLVTAAAMGYYFHAVTGSATRMPFTVNRETYAVAKIFIWQTATTVPHYRNKEMRDFYVDWEYPRYAWARTLPGYVGLVKEKFLVVWGFYLGAALLVPLLFALRYWRSRKMRLLLVCIGLVFVGTTFVWVATPHYFAPAACALYALVLQGLRYMRVMRRRSSGLVLAAAVPIVCLISVPMMPAVRQMSGAIPGNHWVDYWTANRGNVVRLLIAREVRSHAARNLIIVRYGKDHEPGQEWVYNRANIDASPVVWARDLGPEKNRELINYYKDRSVWLLEPDAHPPRLSAYPLNDSASRAVQNK